MNRAAKRPIWILLACIGVTAFAALPVAAAERLAMAGIPAEKPAADRMVTLTLDNDTAISRARRHKGGAAFGPFVNMRFPITAVRTPQVQKALRIDLFRFQVTRPLEGDGATGSPVTLLPSVMQIGVKQGATPDSKAIGVELPLAPNVVVESRLRPGGESDTSVRFRLLY